MIFTDRKITIDKGISKINEPVVVYRGDYEVSIKFTIVEPKFRFKHGVNLVDSEKASHGQLAILAPYGGNVFSDVVKCEDGTVTFTLTKEMIDQLEEVGLYSFQIRLFDYYRESRVSIPPVEFGIEVREPIASEDHDNSVNNAIVGYSIAKIVDGLSEDVEDTFDDNGNYNKTEWETGDRITEGKLNKIEEALHTFNQANNDTKETLSSQMTSNFNVLNSVIQNIQTSQDIIEPLIEELNSSVKVQADVITKMEEKMNSITLFIDDYIKFSNNGEDWSQALQQAFLDLEGTGGVILFGTGTYKFKNKVTIAPNIGDNDYSPCRKFKITSINKTTLEYHGSEQTFIACGKDSWKYSIDNYAKGYVDIELENLILMNMTNKNIVGLDIRNVRKVLLQDLEVRGFSNGIRMRGTWYGSQLKRVVIWSPTPTANTKGLWLDNGVNNTSFENMAILNFDKGVYIYATDNTGDISTLGFRNCNLEFNNTAFYVSPTNANAGNINIDGCHFEYNKQLLELVNTSTIWNVNLSNSLLMQGDIKIHGLTSGATIKGVTIKDNSFTSGANSYVIDMGVDIPDNIENIILGSNQYHGSYTIKRPSIKLKATPQFFEYMPLYNGVNQIPWGNEDTKGLIGEFRHDANNLYFKSIEGWKCIPLSRQYSYEGYKNSIRTFFELQQQTVPASSALDVVIPVQGLNSNFEYAITVSPSRWMENGITCHAYKSTTEGCINIRFTNHTTQDVILNSQRWNIVCQVIDY